MPARPSACLRAATGSRPYERRISLSPPHPVDMPKLRPFPRFSNIFRRSAVVARRRKKPLLLCASQRPPRLCVKIFSNYASRWHYEETNAATPSGPPGKEKYCVAFLPITCLWSNPTKNTRHLCGFLLLQAFGIPIGFPFMRPRHQKPPKPH